jgi:hypothetical protein
MITFLIVLTSVIAYTLIGVVCGGFVLASNRADRKSIWTDPYDLPVILSGAFWPIVLPIFICMPILKRAANFGMHLHGIQNAIQEKINTRGAYDEASVRVRLCNHYDCMVHWIMPNDIHQY